MKMFGKESFKSMPWKNGGGTTLELLKISSGKNEFDLRISIAQVKTDGPFSSFPGIDRCLLILEGEGILLKSSTRELKLNKHSKPFYFQGEEVFDCTLVNGPIEDFNVMTARDWGEAIVNVVLDTNLDFDQQGYVYSLTEGVLREFTIGESFFAQGKNIVIKIKRVP